MFLGLPFLHTAQAKLVEDDPIVMRAAAVDVLNKSAINGLAHEANNCYKNEVQSKLYRYYFDYSSRIISTVMIDMLNEDDGNNIPYNIYFDDEMFGERVYMNLYGPNQSSMDETNQHLQSTYENLSEIIRDVFYQKFDKK